MTTESREGPGDGDRPQAVRHPPPVDRPRDRLSPRETDRPGPGAAAPGLRIVLAEDAPLIAQGLMALLGRAGHEVVSWVTSADLIAPAVTATGADLLVTDVRMPPGQGDDGLRAAVALRAARPAFPVLVLSQYVAGAYARDLLADDAGAVGYLLKERVGDLAEFLAAIRAVHTGGTVVDPEVVRTLIGRRTSRVDRLTDREREVLAAMAQGRTNAEIAGALWVSEAAVVKHVGSIMAKLDLPAGVEGNRRVRAVLAWLDRDR